METQAYSAFIIRTTILLTLHRHKHQLHIIFVIEFRDMDMMSTSQYL